MLYCRRWRVAVAAVAAVVAVLPALGCGIIHRPYADDPILRERHPVWGDPARTRGPESLPNAEPTPPPAPPDVQWVIAETEAEQSE